MRHRLLVLLVSLLLTPAAGAADSLLTSARAADVLADLLTYAVDRTNAHINAMERYAHESGKPAATTRPADAAGRMSFQQLHKAAVVFVTGPGQRYADPMLRGLTQEQLLERLTQLQSYNIQQFLKLTHDRNTAEAMMSQLTAAGEWEQYLAWAAKNAPDVAAAATAAADATGTATRPAAASPADPKQLAGRMEALVTFARELEWRKARAQGVSRADFDRQWQDRLAEQKEKVAEKVDAVRAFGDSLTRSELAGRRSEPPPPPQPAPLLGPIPPSGTWTAQPPAAPPQADRLPPPVESRHTPEYYRRKNDEIWWNPWEGRFYNRNRPVDR